MRRPLHPNTQRQQTAVGRTLPAPVGGWDALNPLAAMPLTNAVVMDNWIPRAGYIELRRGYITHQLTSHPVETLMAFRGGASDLLFAAYNGGIYDVTAFGGSPSLKLGGLSVNRWQHTLFSNAAGAWLIAVNGTDLPSGYDTGSGNWAALPAITGSGLDPHNLINVFSHKGRLYYLEKNSLHVWNPAAGSVGGACTLLDLSTIFNKGGRVVCGANWSAQLGVTADEYAVFVTDQGQVAIYQGIDPTSASLFSLVGVYDFGPPLGANALVKFGGDLALATMDGIIPLSAGLALDRAQQGNVALTRNIMQAFSQAARSYATQVGWQGILTSVGGTTVQGSSLAIFNVPTQTNVSAVQFVQNALTGAWCRFTDQNALSWEIANSNLYFGGVDAVYEGSVGSQDNGQPITAEVLGAFSGFGASGRQKRFTMIRPLMNTISQVQPALDINVDYVTTAPTAMPVVLQTGAGVAQVRYEWTGCSGIGYVGAPHLVLSLKGDTSQPQLAVGDGAGHLLGIDAVDGDGLYISTGLPYEVPCQLLSFDLVYEAGGQL